MHRFLGVRSFDAFLRRMAHEMLNVLMRQTLEAIPELALLASCLANDPKSLPNVEDIANKLRKQDFVVFHFFFGTTSKAIRIFILTCWDMYWTLPTQEEASTNKPIQLQTHEWRAYFDQQSADQLLRLVLSKAENKHSL